MNADQLGDRPADVIAQTANGNASTTRISTVASSSWRPENFTSEPQPFLWAM